MTDAVKDVNYNWNKKKFLFKLRFKLWHQQTCAKHTGTNKYWTAE